MTALLQAPAPHRLAAGQALPGGKMQPHPLALLVCAGCLYLAMLAGLASLHGVVDGYGWMGSAWFPLLLVHGAGALVRASRWPNWLAPAAAAAAVAVTLLLHPALQDRALGDGPLERFGWMIQTANMEFATQVPEVAYTRAVDFAFLVLGLALSLLVEILAGVRALTGLVVLPLSLTPILASLFKPSGAGAGYLVVLLAALIFYFAFLPYAWPARPGAPRLPQRRRLASTGLLAALTAVVLVAAGAWMPGFRQGMLPEGSRPSGQLFASNLDPLLSLGRDLRSNNTATTLTYYTSADAAPYLRTEVISDFNAVRWQPDEEPEERSFVGTTAIRSEFMSFGAASELTEIRWENIPPDRQLPLPANSYLVQDIAGAWLWQPQTSIAQFTSASREATATISVAHSVPTVDAAQARRMAFLEQLSPPVDRALAELPSGADGRLRQLLSENLELAYGGAAQPELAFDRAVAIQNHLRSRRFSYSELTPLREGYDAANLRVITAFLEQRAGYCVHFASTMALMARAAGIPSRVVVGYAPGEPLDDTRTVRSTASAGQRSGNRSTQIELTGYRVSGQQAHAWPELYLPGLGWTPFEPTPGRGDVPDYAPVPTTAPGFVDSGEVPQVPEAATPPAPSEPEDAGSDPQSTNADSTMLLPRLLGWIVLPLLLVAGAMPGVRRARLRRTRQAALAAGGEAAALAAWDELRALGADYGLPPRPGASEADYCAALSTAVPGLGAQLGLLCQFIESSFYAMRHPTPEQSGIMAGTLRALRPALARQARPGWRIRALLWPASTTRVQLVRRPMPAGSGRAGNHS